MHGLYYGLGNVGGCGWFGSDWWSRGMMIGLLLIGVTVVVLLAVHLSHRNRSNSGSLEAIALLKNRYANGEIDSELFEKMKKDLR
jgi:uncharacterized membrane protein